ncbi:hypothetical protein [Streptomyces sp. BPTC-684]|uniref:hypothetical protein n=1 Tax=Streptomyces sp. BPTC-684 TaxID=3043734 RepID=UPI0024B1F68E|nr:hypothetical protein [Streptomyces sp. BPTC-684]WHM40534.1 hypothetical protein QIY60_29150 [Streptomyces sp. BPTC-684]
MPAATGPFEHDDIPVPFEHGPPAPVPAQRYPQEGDAYEATPTSPYVMARSFTSIAGDTLQEPDYVWTVTLATETSDGRTGVHTFVIRTRRAKDAIAIATQEALTPQARAHRRGATLRPGSVVVTLWENEGLGDV